MHAFSRWVLYAATVVSAPLFVGAIVLWVRSYFVADVLSRCHANLGSPLVYYGNQELVSSGGLIAFQDTYLQYPNAYRTRVGLSPHSLTWKSMSSDIYRRSMTPFISYQWDFRCCGFGSTHLKYTSPNPADFEETQIVMVPIPAITLVTALLSAAATAGSMRRRKAMQARHCVQCGYDLRATPTRCPECGTMVAIAGSATRQG